MFHSRFTSLLALHNLQTLIDKRFVRMVAVHLRSMAGMMLFSQLTSGLLLEATLKARGCMLSTYR